MAQIVLNYSAQFLTGVHFTFIVVSLLTAQAL
jgi:hypothetical protein